MGRNRSAEAARPDDCAHSSSLEKVGLQLFLLLEVCCSDTWADDLYEAIRIGRLPFRYKGKNKKTQQRDVLLKKHAYPPGGKFTRMRRCSECSQWVPPGAIGSADICYDCWTCGLDPVTAASMPSSPGFSTVISRSEVLSAGLRIRRGVDRGIDWRRDRDIDRRRFLNSGGQLVEEIVVDDQIFHAIPPPRDEKAVKSEAA